MNLKRTYLWVVSTLSGAYLLVCALSQEKYVSIQQKNINASSEQLAGLIADFDYWKQWYPDAMDTTVVDSIVGFPFNVGHELTLNRHGVEERFQLKYMLSDSSQVDEIFIQRLIARDGQEKGWMKFSFKEMERGNTQLTLEMEQGNIPFLFRGMIAMMQSTNPLVKHNVLCLDRLDRLINGEMGLINE